MNPDHPDLIEMDRHIRIQLDRVLRAEQEAAAVTRRRAATMRDRLIDLEEACQPVVVRHRDQDSAGVVESVGADHIDLLTASGVVIIPLSSIDEVGSL
jgi:hypothetical protein